MPAKDFTHPFLRLVAAGRKKDVETEITHIRRATPPFNRGFERDDFYLSAEDRNTSPFEVALDHQRWDIAFALIDNHRWCEAFLPEPQTDNEETYPETMPEEMCLRMILLTLEDRAGRAPPAIAKRVEELFERIAQAKGEDCAVWLAFVYLPDCLGHLAQPLLDRGGRANQWSRYGEAHLLTMASCHGCPAAVKALLKNGADPLWKDHTFTPVFLHVATPERRSPLFRTWGQRSTEQTQRLLGRRTASLVAMAQAVPAVRDWRDPATGQDTIGLWQANLQAYLTKHDQKGELLTLLAQQQQQSMDFRLPAAERPAATRPRM